MRAIDEEVKRNDVRRQVKGARTGQKEGCEERSGGGGTRRDPPRLNDHIKPPPSSAVSPGRKQNHLQKWFSSLKGHQVSFYGLSH